MLKNFHLLAIKKKGQKTTLLHIPLHRQLQQQLAEEWSIQYDAFMDGIEEIDFDPGYTPNEDTERFVIRNFDPPEWLLNEDSYSIGNLESIRRHEEELDDIKGIAAFAQDASDGEVVLFQNFSRGHVIKPGRFLFLQNNTYKSTTRPGLTLDQKLSAVFLPSERKLLFRSFRTTNTFLPLADFYAEATEQEIREVLAHPILAPEDADALATGATQWMRKRFAMLKASGILNQYSANEIKQRSNGYDVDIQTSDGKIVFPSEKNSAKKLLQFLNEEIFRGPITERLYETNSKRETEQ